MGKQAENDNGPVITQVNNVQLCALTFPGPMLIHMAANQLNCRARHSCSRLSLSGENL